jgi:hypothetical protein
MNHIFHHPATNARFSITNPGTLHMEPGNPAPHKWFSLILFNMAGAEIMVDGEKIEIHQPQAVFVTPGLYILFASDQNRF